MGRKITKEEILMLQAKFRHRFPLSLFDVLSAKEIVGSVFELSEEQDNSGFGVNMHWLTPDEQIEEATEFYPGKVVIDFDYIPIGKCLEGSGDPYFVKSAQNHLQIFRVPHEGCLDFNESNVEYICSLDELLSFKTD